MSPSQQYNSGNSDDQSVWQFQTHPTKT